MSPFDHWTNRDIVDLVDAHPLALVVGAGAAAATPLPMLIETDADGRPVSLLGHFAKRNPQVAQIRATPRTMFLFMGPHGYISPELVTTTRDWAPTWNYVFARIVADVEFDETLNDEAITRLVAKMEHDRTQPWAPAELGDRFAQLKAHVIAFRAPIVEIDARFKLGQDERPEVLSDIVEGSDTALAEWMRRFNPEKTAVR
jgi:transcriptional regulator